MRMQFGLSAFTRARGDLPDLPVINMFAEEAPTEEGQVALQSRPALVDLSADMGTGPVEALFKRSGVLSNALFGVSAGEIYQATTSLGTLAGSGPVSMAGNEIGLMVTAGSTLRYWNGTTLADVVFPDTANVRKVFNGAGRFLMIRDDTGTFYWTPPLAATVAALDFATAESSADLLLDGLFIDDIAILFGAETVEFWPNTGDADLPFQPIEGRVMEKGVKATGCATKFGATFAWVTNTNEVCMTDADTVISSPGLQALIAATVDCRLFTFWFDGSEFLALRIDAGTWVYRKGLWSQFETWGQTNFVAQCWAGDVFGSAIDGRTLEFDGHLELGGELERRFRAGAELNSGGTMIDNVRLRTNPGRTTYLTGDYDDPAVEMRVSRDAGKTWGAWKRRTLGVQGNYRKHVKWGPQGMASQPGFMAEFRVTDPVDFRVSGVFANEPLGGR